MTEQAADQKGRSEYSILVTVRKLLDKAESCSKIGTEETRNEADALIAKAQAMMLQHAIDDAKLRSVQTGPQRQVPVKQDILIRNPFSKAKTQLANACAEHNRCKVVRYTVSGGTRLVVFGFKDDTEFVEMLFTSLQLQLVQEQLKASRDGRSKGAKWQNEFAWAYAMRIEARLHENAKLASRDASDGSLLPAIIKDVNDLFREAYPNLRYFSITPTFGRGTNEGFDAADRADISGGRNTVAPKKALT